MAIPVATLFWMILAVDSAFQGAWLWFALLMVFVLMGLVAIGLDIRQRRI